MSRSVLLAIVGGSVSATLLLAALVNPLGGALLAYFTPLPLMCVGLGLGAGSVPVAAVAGIAWSLVFGGLGAAAVFFGVHAVPSWLVAQQALTPRPPATPGGPARWTPPGTSLATVTVLAACATAGAAVIAAGPEGIEATIRSLLTIDLEQALPPPIDAEQRAFIDQWQRLIAGLSSVFVGVFGAMWVVMLALNAVMAQGLLRMQGRNLRPSPAWSLLTLPDWASWPLVASAVVALVGDGDLEYLARNLVLVFAAPFFFVGLAVAHRVCRRSAYRGFVLAGLYVGLVVAFPLFAGVVTAAGVLEQWFGLRRRVAGAADDGENE